MINMLDFEILVTDIKDWLHMQSHVIDQVWDLEIATTRPLCEKEFRKQTLQKRVLSDAHNSMGGSP